MFGIDGDKTAYEEFKKLIKKYKIKTVVETGTYHGKTTEALASICDNVYSIEINTELYNEVYKKIKDNKRIKLFNMTTINFLKENIPNFIQPILFFLDAHKMEREYNTFHLNSINEPLLDELNIIGENKIKPIIVIHDFMVPEKYSGYKYESIEPFLTKIYGENNYRYYYNETSFSEEHPCGIIYILPKE
jgi:hypothetical protein